LDKPTLMVYNKMDAYRDLYYDKLMPDEVKVSMIAEFKKNWTEKSKQLHPNGDAQSMFISAINKENFEAFRETMGSICHKSVI